MLVKVGQVSKNATFGTLLHGWTALAVCAVLQAVDLRATASMFELGFLLVLAVAGAVMATRHLMATPFGCRGFRRECATLAPRKVSCEQMRRLGACKQAFMGPLNRREVITDPVPEPERRRRAKRGPIENLLYFVRAGAMATVFRYSRWVLNKRLPYVNALATIGLVVLAMASAVIVTQDSGADFLWLGNALRRAVLIMVALYVWRLDMVGRIAVIGASLAFNQWLGNIVQGGVWPINDTLGFAANVGATWLVLVLQDTVDSLIDGGLL